MLCRDNKIRVVCHEDDTPFVRDDENLKRDMLFIHNSLGLYSFYSVLRCARPPSRLSLRGLKITRQKVDLRVGPTPLTNLHYFPALFYTV